MGVLVNVLAIFAGGLVGTFAGKYIPERVSHAVLQGVGLCVIYIGIDGALGGQNVLVLVVSVVLGGILGTYLDIDGRITRFGDKIEKKFASKSNISRGFVAGSLLFCIGAMAIIGPLNSGLSGDNQVLYTKSLLDFVSAIALSSTLGFGVSLSAFSILVYQGAIFLLAGVLAPLLGEYPRGELICAGSVLIMGLGLNLTGALKIKLADFVPAIIIAPLLCLFM